VNSNGPTSGRNQSGQFFVDRAQNSGELLIN
jgi:hypothetical protein